MEEDIKVLEEFIEDYRIAKEVLDGEVIYSIENLIKRNKELEEHHEFAKKKIIELEELARGLEDYIDKQINAEEYIPKSKVREKIEELEAMSISADIYYDDILKMFKELLQEGDEK